MMSTMQKDPSLVDQEKMPMKNERFSLDYSRLSQAYTRGTWKQKSTNRQNKLEKSNWIKMKSS